MEPFYQSPDADFCLYKGDSANVDTMGEQKFDMIFADPPYSLSKGKGICINGTWKSFEKGEWDRAIPLEKINEFNKRWLSECRRILKDDGTIWVCGSYHNIFSVATCLVELGYKILNIIVWQKSNPKPTLSTQYFDFSAEYIVWARKTTSKPHYFNCDLMMQLNGGRRMQDVWHIPIVAQWEMKWGKHPTQKPLRLLYRIILASTKTGDRIFDPFAGSCTTGIAANLLDRKFVGVDLSEQYLNVGKSRKEAILDRHTAERLLKQMSENPEEEMVMVNHASKETRRLMIEKGLCYLRAGDSKGSLLVTPGFERMQYVLLHTNGECCQMFRLKSKGTFKIWTKDTLIKYGFMPEHAPYYIILQFDNTKILEFGKAPNLKQRAYTYTAKIRPLSDFTGYDGFTMVKNDMI